MNTPRRRVTRSTYSKTVEDNFICILDHDRGRSVTNDAENVIADLVAAGFDVDAYHVIYCDTGGTWDWLCTAGGKFTKFKPLHARTKDEAKLFVCTRLKAQKRRDSQTPETPKS